MTLINKTVFFLTLIFLFAIVHGETVTEQDHESRDLRELQELSGERDRRAPRSQRSGTAERERTGRCSAT